MDRRNHGPVFWLVRKIQSADEMVVFKTTAAALTLFLFVIVLIRAAAIEITYDEAYTYLKYTDQPLACLTPSLANNHPLNSFLIYLVRAVTKIDYNELIIRLPNVLAFGLYQWMAFRLSTLFKHKGLLFALLSLNFYLLEFFSLARGYGLSSALVCAALYFYYSKRQTEKGVVAAGYLLLLACASILSTLVLAASFAVYVFVFDMSSGQRQDFLKHNKFHIVTMELIFLYLGFLFVRATGQGNPLYGTDQNFFQAVVVGYIEMFIRNSPVSMGIAILALACLAWALYRLRRTIVRLPSLMMLMIYYGVIVLTAVALNRILPTGRLLLPVYPLCAVAVVETYYSLCENNHLGKRFQKWIPAAVVSVLLLSFITSVNVSYTRDWKGDIGIRARVAQSLLDGSIPPGYDDPYPHPSLVFYARKFGLK